MRIDDENSNINLIESLKKENKSLNDQNNELNHNLIILKDRYSIMVKAIVILSIVCLLSLSILVICGYNYTKDFAEQKLKISDQQKITEDQQSKLDDNTREIQDKKDEVSRLQRELDEQIDKVNELNNKVNHQVDLIKRQKRALDNLRNKSSDEVPREEEYEVM